MKKVFLLVSILFFATIGLQAQTVSKISVGELGIPVAYHFSPSDSLIIKVGDKIIYEKRHIVNQRELTDVQLYMQYAEDFRHEKESLVYWVALGLGDGLGREWNDKVVERIIGIIKREPSFEGFLKWLEEKEKLECGE